MGGAARLGCHVHIRHHLGARSVSRSAGETPLLVSCEWLARRPSHPDLRVADVRWTLVERDRGRREYRKGHIPGAVFLDIDTALAAPRGSGPGRHPLPTSESFATAMSLAGIGPRTHV